MSKAQLDKFAKWLSTDPVAFKEASKGTQDPDEFLRNVHGYATDKGYDITLDEGRAWIADYRRQREGGELNDTQLEAVAGGVSKSGGSSTPTYPDVAKTPTSSGPVPIPYPNLPKF